MKKSVVVIVTLFVANQMHAADASQWPGEIRELIALELGQTGSDFKASIENVKKLGLTDKSMNAVLNSPQTIKPLLKKFSGIFNIPESMVAFALDIRGSRDWLQNKYPKDTLLHVFTEYVDATINQNEVELTPFLKSGYLKKLAGILDKPVLDVFARQKEEKKAELVRIEKVLNSDNNTTNGQHEKVEKELSLIENRFGILNAILSRGIWISRTGYFYPDGTFRPPVKF